MTTFRYLRHVGLHEEGARFLRDRGTGTLAAAVPLARRDVPGQVQMGYPPRGQQQIERTIPEHLIGHIKIPAPRVLDPAPGETWYHLTITTDLAAPERNSAIGPDWGSRK
jgi:hypothetical protein